MPDISISEFADQMNEVMPVIIKEFARRQVNDLYRGKITLPQCFILDFLQREGESKMTHLAQLMNITTAGATGIVDRLVRSGYIVRTYEEKDRRIIKVKLTPAANVLMKKINLDRRKTVIKIFGKMSGSDRNEYLRIIKQVRDILLEDSEKK